MEHTNGEIASIMLPLKDEKIEKESIIKALQYATDIVNKRRGY